MEKAQALAASFHSSKVITIKLEDGGVFQVQGALLSNASDYFKKAIDGNFVESQTNTLTLPGCNTSTFQLFLCWLCERSLPEIDYEAEPPASEYKEYELNLAMLWILGDFLVMRRLQNTVIRTLFGFIETAPFVETIEASFAKTATDSLLRQFIVQCAVAGWYDYSNDEKDQLGEIRGFLRMYVDAVEECVDDCNHKGHRFYVCASDVEEHYIVEED